MTTVLFMAFTLGSISRAGGCDFYMQVDDVPNPDQVAAVRCDHQGTRQVRVTILENGQPTGQGATIDPGQNQTINIPQGQRKNYIVQSRVDATGKTRTFLVEPGYLLEEL